MTKFFYLELPVKSYVFLFVKNNYGEQIKISHRDKLGQLILGLHCAKKEYVRVLNDEKYQHTIKIEVSRSLFFQHFKKGISRIAIQKFNSYIHDQMIDILIRKIETISEHVIVNKIAVIRDFIDEYAPNTNEEMWKKAIQRAEKNRKNIGTSIPNLTLFSPTTSTQSML